MRRAAAPIRLRSGGRAAVGDDGPVARRRLRPMARGAPAPDRRLAPRAGRARDRPGRRRALRPGGGARAAALDKALLACDELTGFVMACCLVRPDGIRSLSPSSVKKKLKDKGFAAKVNREDVYGGAERLGVGAGRAHPARHRRPDPTPTTWESRRGSSNRSPARSPGVSRLLLLRPLEADRHPDVIAEHRSSRPSWRRRSRRRLTWNCGGVAGPLDPLGTRPSCPP